LGDLCPSYVNEVEVYVGKIEELLPSSSSSIYLSPDSPNLISMTAKPPSLLIIGGIIDRNPTPGRSLKRAEEINISHGCLDLESINFDNLTNNEPLNVDTILGVCSAWINQNGDLKTALIDNLVEHEDRHPNRRVHL